MGFKDIAREEEEAEEVGNDAKTRQRPGSQKGRDVGKTPLKGKVGQWSEVRDPNSRLQTSSVGSHSIGQTRVFNREYHNIL